MSKPTSPYLFRQDDLRDPSHRPKLSDVRALDEGFRQLQESNSKLVSMLNNAEAENDRLRDELDICREREVTP